MSTSSDSSDEDVAAKKARRAELLDACAPGFSENDLATKTPTTARFG
jgi:hypothetical protein